MIQERTNQDYGADDLALISQLNSNDDSDFRYYINEIPASITSTLHTQEVQADKLLRTQGQEKTLYFCYSSWVEVTLDDVKPKIFDTSLFETNDTQRDVGLRWIDYSSETINLVRDEQVFSYVQYEEIIFKDIQKSISQGNIERARRQIYNTLEYLPSGGRLNKLKKLLEPPRVISSYLSATKNRTKERQWLRKNSEKFRGKWVALIDDKMIASNKAISKVIKEARNKYYLEEVLLHFIPK